MSRTDDRSDRLYLLVASRESPEKLLSLFDSIEQTASDRSGLEILLYVDEDDGATRELVASGRLDRFGVPVAPLVLPRTRSQGEMINSMAARCADRSGVMLCMPDDYIFGTLAWDEQLREAYWSTGDHVFLAYPVDPTVPRGQVTFAFLSNAWVRTLGRFTTERFTFWFDDSWLDEVAQLVQRKRAVDVVMVPPGGRGKTRRMRNVPFWQSYYHCCFDDRLDDAEKLRAAIWGQDAEAIAVSRRLAQAKIDLLRTNGDEKHELLLAREQHLSANWGEDRERIPASYWEMEGAAVRDLFGKAERYAADGDLPRAAGMLATATKAYRPGEAAARLGALLDRHPRAFRGDIVETQYRPRRAAGDPPLIALEERRAAPLASGPIDPQRRQQVLNLTKQALAFAQENEPALAEALLGTAVRLEPRFPNLNCVYAATLNRLGRRREAIAAAERELQLQPGHPEATKLIADMKKMI